MNKQQSIEMKKVKSSQIAEIGHSGTTLAIRFLNGSLYHYGGVTTKQFDEFKEAKSIGSHFGKHFKSNDKHRYTRIHKEKKDEMKGGSMMRMAALAAIAGLGNALGGSIAGQGSIMNIYRAGALLPNNEVSTTISPYTSPWGYAKGPGWSAAHVKRMAKKRRNRARNKAHNRKARSLT